MFSISGIAYTAVEFSYGFAIRAIRISRDDTYQTGGAVGGGGGGSLISCPFAFAPRISVAYLQDYVFGNNNDFLFRGFSSALGEYPDRIILAVVSSMYKTKMDRVLNSKK